jgi:hypothetical protein
MNINYAIANAIANVVSQKTSVDLSLLIEDNGFTKQLTELVNASTEFNQAVESLNNYVAANY